jgi:hypothetical protein
MFTESFAKKMEDITDGTSNTFMSAARISAWATARCGL